MSMASEVMKLISVVLDVSFNSGHYSYYKMTVLYINLSIIITLGITTKHNDGCVVIMYYLLEL